MTMWLGPLVIGWVAACSSTSQRPTSAEQIAVVGDTTFRATHAGTVVIIVRRVSGELQAFGDATVSGASMEQAEHSPHVRLAGARAWLAVAQLAPAPDASAAAQHGVDELGPDYAPRGTQDDTGTFIKLAKLDKDPVRAATNFRRTLETRIQLYLRRYRGEVE